VESAAADSPPAGKAAAMRHRSAWLPAGIVVGIVALDQLTKAIVVATLSDGPAHIVGDTIVLRLSRNTGGAFSLFQTYTPVLALAAIVVAFVLVRAVQRTTDTVTVVALSLLLGGAIGNLCDRVFRAPGFLRGAVVDFVALGPWPSFNVADSAITVGAILLVMFGWRKPRTAV
jgi:signal peptidase II